VLENSSVGGACPTRTPDTYQLRGRGWAGEQDSPRGDTANEVTVANLCRMCRNIRSLHNFEPPATSDEVRSAALQYVRKISGFSKPSQANAAAFERAIDEVAET